MSRAHTWESYYDSWAAGPDYAEPIDYPCECCDDYTQDEYPGGYCCTACGTDTSYPFCQDWKNESVRG